MFVTVRLFARLRELAGHDELRLEVAEGVTALDVWNGLTAEYPPLADYTKAISVAVNEEYARLSASLRDGDDIAFLPPVSGGSGERAQRREPRDRSEPAKRRARERAGESEGQRPSDENDIAFLPPVSGG